MLSSFTHFSVNFHVDFDIVFDDDDEEEGLGVGLLLIYVQ
jgi:hypothetical protein